MAIQSIDDLFRREPIDVESATWPRLPTDEERIVHAIREKALLDAADCASPEPLKQTEDSGR